MPRCLRKESIYNARKRKVGLHQGLVDGKAEICHLMLFVPWSGLSMHFSQY
jgi:hypothetical protein